MPKAMARHILVKTEAEAAALKKRIAAGEAFDVLAKKYSTCPSGKKGGDLGEVRPGQMVRAVDQVIFKKPLREVHGPVKTQFGYHLIELRERTPGELRPFEQVLPELREELRTKLQATERKAVWDAVQERAQVDPAAVKALSDAHYRPIQIKP